MLIDILTLFPSVFESVFSESIIRKAIEKKIVKIKITNIRDYAEGNHRMVDDKQYGGGVGMIMMVPPIVKAIEKITGLSGMRKRDKAKDKLKVILLSPQGKIFTQKKALELSKYKHLVFVCGHYGGVDERLLRFVDEELSVGDYVLTGGEIPAMVVVDSVVRLIPDVVGKSDSIKNDSLWNNKLANAVYTRPYNFRELKVPKVLLSGNHKNIEKWRKESIIKNTFKKRPDLLEQN
ncbi:MAG: tRNA (guanosine(37)-N1)-methyltransferase TrmD [Elusimicrobia bacterium]|nr:tRNA (guanosine(37)-N1)-methyltransferase TrmD [Elusimicrobiota bacterium]